MKTDQIGRHEVLLQLQLQFPRKEEYQGMKRENLH